MDTNSTGRSWSMLGGPTIAWLFGLHSLHLIVLNISKDVAAAADMVVSWPRCPFSLYSEGLCGVEPLAWRLKGGSDCTPMLCRLFW